ncbi:MAG: dethiobiotin synthase [Phycisphaerae bacterium]|nr:dethiobiotin synthase [Phycisphaerae bacterium]
MNLKFPKHKGVFITGTDTGVGKTLIAGAIAKILRQSGKNTGVFKPIATGCKKTKNGLVSEDAEFLAHCIDNKLGLDVINPVKFKIPAAPFACEKAKNRKVDLGKIAAAYKQICRKSDFVIVEGIGGIKVPITKNIDVLALAKAFKLPVIVAAKSKLGTINHTLLTIDAIRCAGLSLAGIIINGYDEKTKDVAEKTNAEIIKKLGTVKIIAIVPFDDKTNMKKFIIGKKVLKALRNIDWLKIKK